MSKRLNTMLLDLVKMGCFPRIRHMKAHGEYTWRVEINEGTNIWFEDAETPEKAMQMIDKVWREEGCPMDGVFFDDSGNLRNTGLCGK